MQDTLWQYEGEAASVYLLQLQDHSWYLGSTTNAVLRLRQHLQGTGSLATATHGVQALLKLFRYKGESTLPYVENSLLMLIRAQYPQQTVHGDPRWAAEECKATAHFPSGLHDILWRKDKPATDPLAKLSAFDIPFN